MCGQESRPPDICHCEAKFSFGLAGCLGMAIKESEQRQQLYCSSEKPSVRGSRITITHLENLFNILPAGVTSKNDIGDLKMAVAILSCSFLEACVVITTHLSKSRGIVFVVGIHRADSGDEARIA